MKRSATSSVPAPAAGRLREALPDLERAQAELVRDARPVGPLERRDLAGDDLGRRVAGGRERVAEALVAGQALAQPARHGEQLRRAVGLDRGGADAREAALVPVLGALELVRHAAEGCHKGAAAMSALPSRARARARVSGPFG